MVLGLGEDVHEASGEHVDQLDVRVAHHEAPGIAHRDRDLHRELDGVASGGGDRASPRDGILHRSGGGTGARAVVVIDPAGDRVAGEVDDVAVVRVELLDDRVEHAADVGRELLGAALWSQLVREGLGQGREPADVGEQGSTGDAIRQRVPGMQGTPAVSRNVGVRTVAGTIPRGRRISLVLGRGEAHPRIVRDPGHTWLPRHRRRVL